MAEAHSAVAFSFSITHEGWDVNFDREVLHLVWQSGVRSWKKRFARFKVKRLCACVWKYSRVSFCDGLFCDDSLLWPSSSRTEHSRLVVRHCRNSSILSLL